MLSSACTLARLRGLHDAARLTLADGDLPRLVDSIAATAAEALGLDAVAVSVYRPAWDDLEVTSVQGAEIESLELGVTVPLSEWERRLADERRDELFAPLRHSDGRLLGVLSAAGAEGETREGFEHELLAVAEYAAHALESAGEALAAARHRRALEHLLSVSARLAASESTEPVLEAVCRAIRSALHFEHVVIELADREADRYRPVAAVGAELDGDALEIDASIERLDAVFDPAFELEGCYLLPREEALARVQGEPSSFASKRNGRGPRAWNRHWLVVPLRDRDGARVGLIWVDEPSDRLIPSREQLQALRLFADQAATALDAAARYERLHEADEARRALMDASPAGIVVVDPDRRIRWWNPAAQQMFGYPDEAVIGLEPPWIPESEREAFRERFDDMIARELSVERVYRDRREDGTTIDVATSSALLRAPDGHVTGVVTTITDITDEERRKRELARRNAELEALNETTLALIESLDPAGILETIVARAADLIGTEHAWMYLLDEERDELVFEIGTGVFARHVGGRTGREDGLAGRVLATGQPLAVEDYSTWPERMERFADAGFHAVAGVPLRSGPAVVGAFGVGYDDPDSSFSEADVALLSRFGQLASLALANARLYASAQHELEERRAAEEALRRSQELYRAIVENSADLISVVGRDGRTLYASPSHEAVLGWSADELASGATIAYVHPEDAPGASQVLADCFAGLRVEPYAARVRHKDGHWVTLEGSPTAIRSANGEPEMLLVVARDVTDRLRQEHERLRLEEQLRQSQKMEAIGQLAGGIAHDFNNLLTAISGYGELAVARLAAGTPERRHVEEMRRAAGRAGGLTRQLLAFSRKQVLQPEIVDVNGIVSTMSEMLARVLGDDVRLVTRLDPEIGQTRTDPGQLEQVVVNLAVNARDAMPRGGRLTIETANVELDEAFASTHPGASAGHYVALIVSDTGIGMDAETRARVFEPFFTTKAPGEGTGLGLATVYGIVKQTGGQIWVYSEPGRGTTFRVYLPRVWATAGEPEPSRAAPLSASGGETVLLVEDNATVRELVCELLETDGYAVLAAEDAESALELSAAHDGEIDVLMTDVVMPGMSGQELAARLTSERPPLRVLFTSGYTEEAIAHHGILLPGTRLLEKPFTSMELAHALREALAGELAA